MFAVGSWVTNIVSLTNCQSTHFDAAWPDFIRTNPLLSQRIKPRPSRSCPLWLIQNRTIGNSRFPAVFKGIGPQRMNTFFHSAGMPGVWAHWLPSSPGGRFENSPAVDCRVRMNPRISPAGTAESPMSYVSSYCLFRTKDRPRMAQPSLRDFGYLLPNPTLERVGYSQISLREIGVG